MVRQLVNVLACDIQPVQNLRVLRKHGLDHKVDWVQWVINTGFAGLEQLVAQCAGKYCVGDEVSLADVCLVPQVYNADRYSSSTVWPFVLHSCSTIHPIPYPPLPVSIEGSR